MFSCEFCEISRNTFSYKTPPAAALKTFEQKLNCFESLQVEGKTTNSVQTETVLSRQICQRNHVPNYTTENGLGTK